MAIVSWKVNFLLLYLSVLYHIIRKGASLPSSEIGGFLITNWIRNAKNKLKILCGFVHLLLKEPQIIMQGEWEAAGRKRLKGGAKWQRYLFKLLLDLIMAGWLKRRRTGRRQQLKQRIFHHNEAKLKIVIAKWEVGGEIMKKYILEKIKSLKRMTNYHRANKRAERAVRVLDCEIPIGI